MKPSCALSFLPAQRDSAIIQASYHRLYIRSHCAVTHWFVDYGFEALSSAFWPLRHLVFLQPEVTREGVAKYNRTLNNTFLGDQKGYN